MKLLMISVIVANIIAILIPKRLSMIEMYATSAFALIFDLIVDIYIDIRLNLYGYFNHGPDYRTLIVVFGLYPALNIIILNYFPKGIKSKLFYILVWSVFLTAYEWAAINSGFLYYNYWKYIYSFVCYLVIIPILYWNLRLVRKLIGKSK
jgi:hypothetical protein